MRLFASLVLLILLTSTSAIGAEENLVVATPTLTYGKALVLGLVEGITEYLPISSTGHLILVNHFFGLDAELPARDRQGQLLYPRSAEGETPPQPLTVKALADAYAVIIQFGAIAAVLILYRGRVRTMLLGLMGKSREGLLLVRNLLAAFLPAAVIGLLLADWIDRNLFDSLVVVTALFLGGLLMLGVEAWRRRTSSPDATGPDLHELSLRQCVMIGLLQCVAMWPGTSRSMMTIVGGYFAGFSPRRAAEFSFLLGLITLSAATGYKTLKGGTFLLAAFGPGPLLTGMAVAALSAALAVRWLVGYLGRHGLAGFAWYRMALAVLVFWLL